jgi:hypothetical protein
VQQEKKGRAGGLAPLDSQDQLHDDDVHQITKKPNIMVLGKLLRPVAEKLLRGVLDRYVDFEGKNVELSVWSGDMYVVVVVFCKSQVLIVASERLVD